MCLAYPMKILEIRDNKAYAEAGGIKKEIIIELLEGVKVGDYVMVHAGYAIEKVEKTTAEEIRKVFREYEKALQSIKR